VSDDTRIDAAASSDGPPRSQAADRGESTGGSPGWRVPGDPQTLNPNKVTPRHLLVCLDRSPESECLIRHAAALAKALRARVTIIHVLESADREGPPHPADAVDWRLRRQEARRYLADVISQSARRNLEVRMALVEGRAFEEIEAWSKSHAVDLTILTTHGEKGRTGCGLSGTAYKLIDGSSGSVLVVPTCERGPALEGEASYKRILVPLDGSLHAESALPIAARLAAAHRAELVLAHVVAAPELMRSRLPTAADRALEQAVIQRNESVARDYLVEVRNHLQDPRFKVVTYLSRLGSPREELLRFIHDEAIDLVVLSAHGETGATDRPLGSVAAHLVAHARVPMLLARRRTAPRLREDRASSPTHTDSPRPPSAMTA
jgi:nucleotide-binding universal stress UspA family protein